MKFDIGIDVGGTFTDCVAIDSRGHLHFAKALSTKGDPTPGILTGIRSLAGSAGMNERDMLEQCDRLAHGTTIGTNMVIERKGARVGLICTAGHRDAILMMRGAGGTAGKRQEDIYAPQGTRPPQPIVPRAAILEVHERIDRDGEVVVPLDLDELQRSLPAWIDNGEFDAIAICLLWSFRNPAHEQAIAELIRSARPHVYVSISSAVAPRMGEYERTVAAVINAYVGPASSTYIEHLTVRLHELGLDSPLLVMQSNGGVLSAAMARSIPLALIDSGPTGGLSGASALARAADHPYVIAADMGGTSFDVGLILDGMPLLATEREIGQYTYQLPHLDVRSIACGGGSIARVDNHTRSIRVGPDSAGSEPGPACYGRGGTLPTVTDADVVLGLLRPENFLGGTMRLDREAARKAVSTIAEPLGLTVEQAAAGILRINNMNAALLIRQRTIEQGHDPRDFVVYAFGGAGAVHAFGFSADLGVKGVVIPLGNGASTLSAYGIATADSMRVFETECRLRTPIAWNDLERALAIAVHEAVAAFDADDAVLHVERSLLMRYVGQFFEALPVTIPDGPVSATTSAYVLHEFEREYERLYGAGSKIVFQDAEAFAIRIKITGRAGRTTSRQKHGGGSSAIKIPDHRVFWPDGMEWRDTPVYDADSLSDDASIEGPALVELPHTTIAVAPGQHLSRDGFGGFFLQLQPVPGQSL